VSETCTVQYAVFRSRVRGMSDPRQVPSPGEAVVEQEEIFLLFVVAFECVFWS